ncbi:MAG: hypothetical protein FJW40_14490 [Acidobacteria bacterium]|nr:hypothetical protein [Acidobacteriota bacterium]
MTRLLRMFRDHFWWKAFSVAVAWLMWLVLVNDPEVTSTLSVPVQYRNLGWDLEISSDLPAAVMVQVRGPQSAVREMAGPRAAVQLDLSTLTRAGERTFTMRDTITGLSSRLGVVNAVPSQLRVTVERRTAREVPVDVKYASLPEGFRMVSADVTPDVLRILGPETLVRKVNRAQTDLVELEAAEGVREYHVSAYVSEAHVSFAASPVVLVKVTLEKNRK